MQSARHTAAHTAALALCKLPWLQAVLLFILDSEGSFDLPLGSVSVQCSCVFWQEAAYRVAPEPVWCGYEGNERPQNMAAHVHA